MGLCSSHGKIIDGAVDSKFANVAARKKYRVDNITVCGKSDPPSVVLQDGTVFETIEYRIVKMLKEHITDKFLACDTSATVIEQYHFF